MHKSFTYFGKKPQTTQETVEKVEQLVRKDLEERFKDEIVFDQIVANPELNWWGDEFVHIYIIYVGDREKLDPRWTNGIERRLLAQLPEDELLRKLGRTARASQDFKNLYDQRQTIERFFGSAKHSRLLDQHQYRGMSKIRLHVALSMLTYTATMLDHVRCGRKRKLRHMRIALSGR